VIVYLVNEKANLLLVSDFDTEEWVQLRQVEEVKETRLWNPKLIKLRLRRAGKWGDLIVFIAPLRFQFVFMDHPLALELRTLVSEAGGKGSAVLAEPFQITSPERDKLP
jgi:hypothetical protein